MHVHTSLRARTLYHASCSKKQRNLMLLNQGGIFINKITRQGYKHFSLPLATIKATHAEQWQVQKEKKKAHEWLAMGDKKHQRTHKKTTVSLPSPLLK